jgi:hypothetical protein
LNAEVLALLGKLDKLGVPVKAVSANAGDQLKAAAVTA